MGDNSHVAVLLGTLRTRPHCLPASAAAAVRSEADPMSPPRVRRLAASAQAPAAPSARAASRWPLPGPCATILAVWRVLAFTGTLPHKLGSPPQRHRGSLHGIICVCLFYLSPLLQTLYYLCFLNCINYTYLKFSVYVGSLTFCSCLFYFLLILIDYSSFKDDIFVAVCIFKFATS